MVVEPNLHEAQQMHAERFAPLPSGKVVGVNAGNYCMEKKGILNLLLFCLIHRRSFMV